MDIKRRSSIIDFKTAKLSIDLNEGSHLPDIERSNIENKDLATIQKIKAKNKLKLVDIVSYNFVEDGTIKPLIKKRIRTDIQ